MAKELAIHKRPEPPDDDEKLEPSLEEEQASEKASEKEIKRRARQEQRLERKRQKAELARITREMRSSSKAGIIWGTAETVVMIVLIGGTYGFWCFYSVNLQRTAFLR